MKQKLFILLSLTLLISSCDSQRFRAKSSIQDYMCSSFTAGETIRDAIYSPLYIIAPADESKLPEVTGKNMVAELSMMYESLILPLTLSSVGCTNDVFDQIVRADSYFRKYDAGVKTYAMFGFFEIVDSLGNHTAVPGCFTLDSELNVVARHEVFDKRYVYFNTIKK